MKRPRIGTLLLAGLGVAYTTLAVSDAGVMFWLSDTTERPQHGNHQAGPGVITTFRCHYFTGTGTFSFESSIGFGDEPCGLLKRQSSAKWKFRRTRFA
jgi:hypothetical protein